MKRLRISSTLSLGDDFVTKTAAILAQRRKGKTYTGSVVAEEMVEAKVPFVALDPTGAWWGLRASADGKSEGLPVTILGGQHGDAPIERGDGEAVAELVVDEPGHYVIDFSSFESGAAEKSFATDFAKRLYRRKGQPNSDFAMHLFVDEANRFVPQQIRDRNESDQAMLGAFETLVLRGGLRGLGTTLISQRAAVVNKNVLEQIDILIMLRIVGPNDQKTMRDYVKANGTAEEQTELMGSLASLGIGEAWVWEPGGDPPLFKRVQIRERATFNSSATPKPGERRIEPRRLAPVDLQKVMTSLAGTIQKAKLDDPEQLRKLLKERDVRIHGLERDKSRLAERLAVEPQIVTETETVTETIEVPVFDEELVIRLEEALEPATALMAEVQERLAWETNQTDDVIEFTRKLRDRREDLPGAGTTRRRDGAVADGQPGHRRGVRPEGSPARGVSVPASDLPTQRPDPPARREPGGAAVPRAAQDGKPLTGTQRQILTCLAQYPGGIDQQKVARLTGKKYSRAYRNSIYDLRSRGLLTGDSATLEITSAGLAELGDWEPLPTGYALLDWWLDSGKLTGLERAIIEHLVKIYPNQIHQQNLAEDVLGREYTRAFRNSVYKLRGLALLTGKADSLRASAELIDGA